MRRPHHLPPPRPGPGEGGVPGVSSSREQGRGLVRRRPGSRPFPRPRCARLPGPTWSPCPVRGGRASEDAARPLQEPLGGKGLNVGKDAEHCLHCLPKSDPGRECKNRVWGRVVVVGGRGGIIAGLFKANLGLLLLPFTEGDRGWVCVGEKEGLDLGLWSAEALMAQLGLIDIC